MTAEELKQIFGRAVPDRGKLQEIRLRAGKPVLAEMVREGMFSRYVALSRRMGPGTVEAVCDGELRLLAGKGCQNEGNGAGSLETEGKAEAPGA